MMLLNTEKMARELGMSQYMLRRLAKCGAVPFVDTGLYTGGRGRMLFNAAAVRAALDARSEADRAEREAAALAEATAWR